MEIFPCSNYYLRKIKASSCREDSLEVKRSRFNCFVPGFFYLDNKTDYQTAFDFMLEGDHEVVVFGVLKRLNVRPWHEHYQDLVQEGRLEFVDAYQKYPDQRDDEKQMLSYIYQSVKWRLLDKLRRSTRVSTPILRGGGGRNTNQPIL